MTDFNSRLAEVENAVLRLVLLWILHKASTVSSREFEDADIWSFVLSGPGCSRFEGPSESE